MTEEKRVSYSVINQQRQPLEVHLADRVLVLGPYQELAVDAQAMNSGHLAELRKNRLISIRAMEETQTLSSDGEGDPTTSKKAPAARRQVEKRDADGL